MHRPLPFAKRQRTRQCHLRSDRAPYIVACDATVRRLLSLARRQCVRHCRLNRDSAPSIVACEATVRPPLSLAKGQCALLLSFAKGAWRPTLSRAERTCPLHRRPRSDIAPSIVPREATVCPLWSPAKRPFTFIGHLQSDRVPSIAAREATLHTALSLAKRQCARYFRWRSDFRALHCRCRIDSAFSFATCGATVHPPLSLAKRQCTFHCSLRNNSAPPCRLRSDRAT